MDSDQQYRSELWPEKARRMPHPCLTVHRRASIAWDALRSHHKHIQATLRSLSALPRERWPENGAHLVNPGESLYRLHVPPEYVVFFSATDSAHLVIEDIMNERVVEQLRSAK
jgi:hypothetical protein